MNILLTHGYFINEDPAEQKIMKPYPPLGILYISSYLKQNGINNKIFDTTFSRKSDLQEFILKQKPKYLAVYVNLMTKLNVLEIIKFVKQSSTLANTKIILGGPEVKYNAENFIKHGAGYIVIGEGEQTTYELIKALENNECSKIHSIQGLCFKENDKTIFTNERTKIKNIDELPIPNRGAINIKDYIGTWKKHHGQSALSVSTMRGCPYTCKWCSRAVYGLSYRRRSSKLVVKELIEIKERYNPDTIWFVDDVFTISHKWLNEFYEEIKKNDLKIKYECITRSDRMNEDVIKVLKESGCFRVWIGAESGSQKIIDLMDRRVDVNNVREMIKLSKKYGIETGTFIMLGYPGETEEDIEKTISHLKESNPDHFTITLSYPINGTDLFYEVESIHTNSIKWEEGTDRDIDFKRTYNRRYYDYAIQRVINEVNFNKMVIESNQSNKNALLTKARSIKGKAGMWWYKNFSNN